WLSTLEANSSRLAVIRNGTVEHIETATWLPPGSITALQEDYRHGVWIGTSGGVCQWSPAVPPQCWLTDPPSPIGALQSSSSGDVIVLDGRRRQLQTFGAHGWSVSPQALPPLTFSPR